VREFELPDLGEHVTDRATPWLLAYTSGTTGDPKAIEFNHERLLFYRLLQQAVITDPVTYDDVVKPLSKSAKRG